MYIKHVFVPLTQHPNSGPQELGTHFWLQILIVDWFFFSPHAFLKQPRSARPIAGAAAADLHVWLGECWHCCTGVVTCRESFITAADWKKVLWIILLIITILRIPVIKCPLIWDFVVLQPLLTDTDAGSETVKANWKYSRRNDYFSCSIDTFNRWRLQRNTTVHFRCSILTMTIAFR